MSVLDSTSRPQDEPSRSRLRAETPPAHHWRRWVGDATPEDMEEAPDAGESPTMNSLPQPPVDTAPATPPTEAPAAAAPQAPEPVDPESPYRVLIVEDDRGQALFAQSVLHGAGMQAEVQMQSDGLLDAMRRFRPDLVLMDLHMPGKDGMSLTMLLRQQPEYLHLPIVFLTGDPDPERQFEVLESGADDFLNKPIRPRHLIAAVSNRIQRARQRTQALQAPRPSVNSDTGLPTRTFVLQQLADSLQRQSRGGLFFVEVNSALSLRERFLYAQAPVDTRTDQLMQQFLGWTERHAWDGQAGEPGFLHEVSENSRLDRMEQVLREDPAGIYARMDFATRDHYRHVVERLARNSAHEEQDVARAADLPSSRAALEALIQRNAAAGIPVPPGLP